MFVPEGESESGYEPAYRPLAEQDIIATVGAERFSTIKSHQFQLAPITKIVPLGPVSQWDDSSQTGPSTKGPAIRVDPAIIQATKTTSWLHREIRSGNE